MAKINLPQLTRKQVDRFWNNVKIQPDGCYEWRLHRNKKGYGNVKINRTEFVAHRIAYKIYYGTDPKELLVLHHCDNPACCNPLHFFLGTDLDNARDRDIKRRGGTAKGLSNGKYTKPEKTPRGEQNGSAKLNVNQVVEIRRRYDSEENKLKIASDFNVSLSTVNLIGTRTTWKHISVG